MENNKILKNLSFLDPELISEIQELASAKEIPKETEILREGQYVKVIPVVLEGLIRVFSRLATLEKLCLLLKCTPNDLMQWMPDKQQTGDEDHPMNIIKTNKDDVDIIRLINSVPLGKLHEIEEMIERALKREEDEE